MVCYQFCVQPFATMKSEILANSDRKRFGLLKFCQTPGFLKSTKPNKFILMSSPAKSNKINKI